MNFEQNGNVTVCCYNRRNVLGRYPYDTLEKVWYGREAMELRRHMKSMDLPKGCEICYAQFESRNFSGLHAQLYDHLAEEQYPERDGRFLPMPKVMEFEISNVCNLECSMCSGYWSSAIRANREKLPPLKSPYDEDFVKQLEAFIPHLQEAKFLGGEPFLIKTYYQIWDLIIRLNPGITVSITTNGTILNARIKEILEQLRVRIVMSIDSLDEENYERIRVNAKFEQVMENFHYFRDYARRKNTGITIAVCPMQSNWREIPRLLDFCNEHDVYLYFNTVLRPKEASLMLMKPDELLTVVNYLRSAKLTDETEIQVHNNIGYLGLINQIASDRGDLIEEISSNREAPIEEVPSNRDHALEEISSNERDLTLEYFAAASQLVEQHQYREALEELRKVPKNHGMHHVSLAISSNIQRLLCDFEGAQEDLQRAITLSQYGAESILYRTWLRLDENRLKEELAAVIRARQRMQQGDQQEAGACEVLGSLYALQGKITEAVRAFDRLVELQPKNSKAHIRRGLVFKSAAQQEVVIALALDPHDADALELKAVL